MSTIETLVIPRDYVALPYKPEDIIMRNPLNLFRKIPPTPSEYSEGFLLDVLAHLNEGIDRFIAAYHLTDTDARTVHILNSVAPYTARYWVKAFEKATEAAICANVISGIDADPITILDVGSDSGQMVEGIVNASGRSCRVDALDNMQERDTYSSIFLSKPFARKFIEADFNRLSESPGLGRYDVVLGLNSIRMADDLPGIVKELSGLLNKNGLLIFNTISPRFHDDFFRVCLEFAERHDTSNKARYTTGANYIPNAYSVDQLSAVGFQAGLDPVTVATYLTPERFPVYDYFPLGYQFFYPYATYGSVLSRAVGEAYTTTYARFLVTLASRLNSFLSHQCEAWEANGADGEHVMAIMRGGP